MIDIKVAPHPRLRLAAFVTDFPGSLADVPSPDWLTDLLRLDAPSPFTQSEELRAAVRDMLRVGGHKPTGRGKPASEYLIRSAVEEGTVRPINVAVDACNAVSLHSGFPISLVDLRRAQGPFAVAVVQEGHSYVFNASGQEIDLGGLVCLFDAEGPCANAVKDSQRTKTDGETTSTLSVVWGCVGFEKRLEEAEEWYREILERAGAVT